MIVKLINMPFGAMMLPSIGLTQLQSVLKECLGNSVEVDINYASLDFATMLPDVNMYNQAHTPEGFMSFSGEWIFSQCAFPEQPDNQDQYFSRYYFEDTPTTIEMRSAITTMRKIAPSFLDMVIEKYKLLNADVVGFSLLFFQTTASIALAQRLKQKNPHIVIVAGGSCCDGIPGQELARQIDAFDYVFSGPALVSFPAFIKNLMDERQDACEIIDGVFSKSNESKWHIPGKQEGSISITGAKRNINDVVHLDYSSFLDAIDDNFEDQSIRKALLFETSRGCWWGEKSKCSFCGLNGCHTSYDSMKPELAIKYIDSLMQYSKQCSFFIAVDNCMPTTYPKEVFRHIQPPKNVYMRYEVKSNIAREDISILHKAHVQSLQPGIESLSTRTLQLMRKGVTASQNIRFLRDCTEPLVHLEWNLLIFTPGESESVYLDYLALIPKIIHLQPPLGVFPIMYVRYSHYFDHANKFDLDLVPQEFYKYIFPFNEKSIANLAFFYHDKNRDTTVIDYWLDKLNTAVSEWKNKWKEGNSSTTARLVLTHRKEMFMVYDSRATEAVEHKLTNTQARILLYTLDPITKEQLQVSCTNDGIVSNIENDINYMLEKNLILEIDNKLLSLVICQTNNVKFNNL